MVATKKSIWKKFTSETAYFSNKTVLKPVNSGRGYYVVVEDVSPFKVRIMPNSSVKTLKQAVSKMRKYMKAHPRG